MMLANITIRNIYSLSMENEIPITCIFSARKTPSLGEQMLL